MIFDKFVDAWDRKDAEAELALFHDDWEFKFHSSGKVMKKGDLLVVCIRLAKMFLVMILFPYAARPFFTQISSH